MSIIQNDFICSLYISLISNGIEVAMVYYRAGYDPSHYPTEREWSARLLMEKSRALKCPSISYHLITTKKIQQVLSNAGVLERYMLTVIISTLYF